jgi:hypothetical protein
MIGLDHMVGAIDQYGEAAVSDMVARIGSRHEIVILIDIGAIINLQKISKYDYDGKSFRKRR